MPCKVCGAGGHNARTCERATRAGAPARRTQNVVLITEEHGAVRVPLSPPIATVGPIAAEVDALDRALVQLRARILKRSAEKLTERDGLLLLHLGQAVAVLRFLRTLDVQARAWLGPER